MNKRNGILFEDERPKSKKRGKFLASGGKADEIQDKIDNRDKVIGSNAWKDDYFPGNDSLAGQTSESNGVIALNYYPKKSKARYSHPIYSIAEMKEEGWFQMGWSKKYTTAHENGLDFPELCKGDPIELSDSSGGLAATFFVEDIVERSPKGRSNFAFNNLSTFSVKLIRKSD